jgi:hypothetical protein
MSDNNNSAKEAHTFDDLYAGRFFKASQMQGRNVTLTIADVWTEELEGEKGADRKAILAFRETDRQLVLPKINGVCIRAMFGANVSASACTEAPTSARSSALSTARRAGARSS